MKHLLHFLLDRRHCDRCSPGDCPSKMAEVSDVAWPGACDIFITCQRLPLRLSSSYTVSGESEVHRECVFRLLHGDSDSSIARVGQIQSRIFTCRGFTCKSEDQAVETTVRVPSKFRVASRWASRAENLFHTWRASSPTAGLCMRPQYSLLIPIILVPTN
ncbi:hypothetical protein HETIRDRAFT_323075 [Heterobasidion irregulare TC 32-1]|uniref:Uncharacterized protein n=1 Tax=Heterobasidion irregulare (strain TC 32-1) TaxID=747525 RepID=W4K082_HETIT|nr:uncharacterized protein HETIRDRAFT_323075 [Heterobasidion irregulare TC 32-1]ETW79228.1 hypothetical protein HETIRDRAFT_323075 [Heterobasidion irregulare TC 32-1]